MTKGQAEVIQAALQVLNDQGYAGVSLRAVARQMGVRMNTVVWHVKSKKRLDELMADAIVAGVSLEGLPDHWQERAAELARRYRRALLAYRDGASVVVGTYAAEPATLAVADALTGAFLDGGFTEQEAAWTCWCVAYLTLGLCQEEQALPRAPVPESESGHLGALHRTWPFVQDGSFDERFDYGIAKLIAR